MSIEQVRDHLERYAAADRIRRVAGSSATVPLAAAGIGVEPDRIAKTLAVTVKGENRLVIVVVSGESRLDNKKFKAAFGGKPGFLQDGECEAATGHPPGGVCPFGLNPGLEVFLDVSLQKHESVFPAAGEHDSFIELTPGELAAWSGGQWVDVAK